jgi:molybdate transport system ATP-binding protein
VLFGPSGSGKTSLLRALCGLPLSDPSAQAMVERRSKDGAIASLAAVPACRRDIAYAPQAGSLFPHLTAARNVRFPFEVCASPPPDASMVDEALTLFHLHVLADRLPGDLSGGEQQRVNLARAFATPGAKLMLLDEPFTGIDRTLRDSLIPELRRILAARGLPAISVTHDVEEALLLNAEVLRLDSGQITAQGPARKVLANEIQSIAAILDNRASPAAEP